MNGGTIKIITSPDGINWTARTSANNNTYFGVCWSSELSLFTAVSSVSLNDASNNRIMTSPDGINWIARINSNNLNSVCWSPELGIFVACSTSQGLITSSLAGRPPTSYNIFDSSFNSIDSTGNWAIQQVLKSATYTTGTTTPSVLGTNLMYITNNPPTPTIITNFTNGSNGQMLTLIFNDGNTRLSASSLLRLSGGISFNASTNNTLTLINNGSSWLEISRSLNF